MYRMSLIACTFCVIATIHTNTNAQSPRQKFSDWRPRGNNQLVCRYYFKVNPEDKRYKYQYVVWLNERPDTVFYYSKKNKYWCAASLGKKDKWNVFPMNGIKFSGKISEIPAFTDFPQDPPPIPGTKGTDYEAPMIFPDIPALKQLIAKR